MAVGLMFEKTIFQAKKIHLFFIFFYFQNALMIFEKVIKSLQLVKKSFLSLF